MHWNAPGGALATCMHERWRVQRGGGWCNGIMAPCMNPVKCNSNTDVMTRTRGQVTSCTGDYAIRHQVVRTCAWGPSAA